MSQKKVDQKKQLKLRNKNKAAKRKKLGKLMWILAGCIVFGMIGGFLLGKYLIYPKIYGPQAPETGIETELSLTNE